MKLVVSHKAASFEALAAQARERSAGADLVELRLDGFPAPDEVQLAALIEALARPVIVAVNDASAFGSYQGSDAGRLELLRTAARAGARFVDVDLRLAGGLGELPAACTRIVSHHDTRATPAALDALQTELRLLAGKQGLTKLVTHAECAEDGLRLLATLARASGMRVGFCSGESGRFTRVLCGLHGSEWTYCAPARADATAPGQFALAELRGLLPERGLGPATRVYGVIGNPARHSWSPALHGAGFRSLGADAVYLAFEARELERFLGLFSYGHYEGFSITAPFKEAAAALRVHREEEVQRTGAANTLARMSGLWIAHNTDVYAVRETLRQAFGRPAGERTFQGLSILVLGAGGAARAALEAVREAGGNALVAARDLARAGALASEFGARALPLEALAGVAWDALVHCTPQGSRAAPGRMPIDPELLRPGTVVLDAVYRPRETPLLAAARARGCRAIDGGEWFVRQATLQFAMFSAVDVDGQPKFGRLPSMDELGELFRATLAELQAAEGGAA